MASVINMPKLGLNMKEGLIVSLYVAEGDSVKKGQPLFSVETDKVVNDVEADLDGVVNFLANEGDSIPVAEPVAVITQSGEKMPDFGEEKEETPSLLPKKEAMIERTVKEHPNTKISASPKAKRRARELGIDIATVTGSGKNGEIGVDDVEKKAARGNDLKANPSQPLSNIRKTIAKNMISQSQKTASVTLMCEADASKLTKLREKLNKGKSQEDKISYNAILIKITSTALQEFPNVNAHYSNGLVETRSSMNIGLAVDTENGLIVPVLKNVESLSLEKINQRLNILVTQVADQSYSPDDISGNSFTITNLGSYGIDYFTPIINTSDSAIIGVGRIVEKPVAENGKVVVRPVVFLSLTFDHQWIDGAPAAKFLNRVANIIENPEVILK